MVPNLAMYSPKRRKRIIVQNIIIISQGSSEISVLVIISEFQGQKRPLLPFTPYKIEPYFRAKKVFPMHFTDAFIDQKSYLNIFGVEQIKPAMSAQITFQSK